MKLLEHESKSLLADCQIPIPASSLIKLGDTPTITTPYVLKSQVLTGGRGKAGGIVVVEHEGESAQHTASLFQLPIKGLKPTSLLAEEKLSIQKEFYLSVSINRATQGVTFMAHTNGGIEVEDNDNFKLWNLEYDAFDVDTLGQELADYYNLPEQTFVLQDLIENLYTCFVKNDATLIEINPLILTTDNRLIAGDCKMTLDDAAAYRHDWNYEGKPARTNFITIDLKGNIATIANGAGLAMATVDAAFEAGLKPANFLDIGGGANTETLLTAFHELMKYPSVQAIVVNIFAGITRADEVARAIVSARHGISGLPPLFIRLAGTNDQAAIDILSGENIVVLPSLDACLKKAKEVIHG
jgi:succinyl-CoA synthetase beta subunit